MPWKGLSRNAATYCTSDEVMADDECTVKDLSEIIEAQDWKAAFLRCENHPHETMLLRSRFKTTPLHQLSYIGSSPCSLMERIADAYPNAVFVQDCRYQDTPLHYLSRNSQRTESKMSILVRHSGKEGLLIQNKLGHTPLHTACGSNAMLPVLKKLVAVCPESLYVRDVNGGLPLDALWNSYMQTIPSMLAVGRILSGGLVGRHENFLRFWDKVKFICLAMATPYHPRLTNGSMTDAGHLFLHALLHYSGSLDMIVIAIKVESSLALSVDMNGNYFLHSISLHWSKINPQPKSSFIQSVIDLYPEAAMQPNSEGRVPLQLAIHSGMQWSSGLKEILLADPTQLCSQDPSTKLYPFLLAATAQTGCTLDTVYQLLTALPAVIQVFDC
jgi:hypothetical protein